MQASSSSSGSSGSERFRDDLYCADCVDDSLEYIWSSVSNAITKRWLTTIDTPIAVEVVMLKMKKMVAWSVASHDGNIDSIPAGLERRISEAEPVPSSIDPWARGTVPTKKEVIDPYMHLTSGTGPPSVSSRPPSEAGSERSGTGKSLNRSYRDGASAAARSSRRDDNIAGTIIELDEEIFDWNATGGMFNQLQKAQRQKLKEMKARAAKAGVDEFAQMKEDIVKAQQGLMKGNKDKTVKFVIDKEGKLITVEPVRPESLPPFAVPLGPTIGHGDESTGDKKGKRDPRKKSVRVAGALSVPLEDLYFKAANTLASTLAGGEHIKEINPGVTIQAGENTRFGPEAVVPPGKQSRREYLRGVGTTGSFDASASYLDSPGTANEVDVHFALEGGSVASEFDRRPSSPQVTMSAPGTASMRLPDIDIFEGSRRVVPPEPTVGSISSPEAGEDGGAGMGVDGGGSKGDLSLVANRLPVKPSDSVRHNMTMLHGGPDIAGNRDRDVPLSKLAPSERTKLPAPGIGRTTGHGLPVVGSSPEKSGQLNSASFASNQSPMMASASYNSKSSLRKGSIESQGLIIKERPDIARHIR